jgi:hypothetical protein
MLASVDKGFVLLAQQKTGTTALQRAFRPHAEFHVGGSPKWKHITYREFKDIFGDYFERHGCEIFGVVRDPVEHLKSIYRFRTRGDAESGRSTQDVSFSDFITAWASDDPPPFARYQTPRDFFATAEGGTAPISYYRYESLDLLRQRLNALIGREIELKPVNVSPRMDLDYDHDALMALPRMQDEYAFYNSLDFKT